jgi:hypothetical protein
MELEEILAQNRRLGIGKTRNEQVKRARKSFFGNVLSGLAKAILFGSCIGSAVFLYQSRQHIESRLAGYLSNDNSYRLPASKSREHHTKTGSVQTPQDTIDYVESQAALMTEDLVEVDECYIRKNPKGPNPMLERLCSRTYKGEMICTVGLGADNNTYYMLKMIPGYYEMITQQDSHMLRIELGLDSQELPLIMADTFSNEIQKINYARQKSSL